ncbi:hypothetical protein A2572_02920 [Candidatus Collierbacteria bacterium RIFOXYD1_FULL_40_9]|uniref:Uncharacterized protein n=1 Tax=Candidatus Collierbacteria bacterium RIFOXYD1_FULL_40_9 TaxID=1817731 RepID=A0A1F5FUV2_9BACT|nr:MAG: hypothetical protein A2572_02920 [Candidatus Collierbacteria bacterium RIFOXYD1_FULL_40_9]
MKTPRNLYVLPMILTCLRRVFVLGMLLSLVAFFVYLSLGLENEILLSLKVGVLVALGFIVTGETFMAQYNSKHLGVSASVYLTAKFFLGWSDYYMYSLKGVFDKEYNAEVRNKTGTSR